MQAMAMRNEPLDWLRGLLAASIMICHLVGWEIAQQDASTLLGRLGAYGVSMFFILSGLSIALVYHGFIAGGSTASRFFVRRIFRIWPLMWIVVIIAAVTHAAQGDPVSWKVVAINLTTLFGFIKPTAYINTGAWSIGNEMVYYALTPVILAVYDRSTRSGNVLTGATVLVGLVFSHVLLDAQVPIAEQWGTYVNPFNNLFLYCGGIALYYNANQLEPSKATCLAILAAGLSLAVDAGDGAKARMRSRA
jgi:peptidoglycan/LPS O-acetylase OafA/YrhL